MVVLGEGREESVVVQIVATPNHIKGEFLVIEKNVLDVETRWLGIKKLK